MDRPRRPFRPFLALALLAGLAPLARADGWPVPRGPSHEPDPYTYDAKKPPAVPKEVLDAAAACVLYSGNSYLVEADGTIETVTHELTRLNGRKGIEKLGEYRSITYDPSYQTLTLHQARIHKADGRTLDALPRHLQLRDVATDFQVYDHEKQLIISFPSLEVGDVLEVKWTVRGKNPEHDGRFFTRYSFGDPQFPVLADEFRVRLPRDKPFKYATIGGKLDPRVKDDGPWRTWTWRAVNCRRLPQDDNLPSREELRQSLACSTFASWEEVGRWKQRLRADCWECTAEVRRVVQEVTKGLKTPEERARALTYWLRQKIRYVSSGEKHDYTPHPPAEVIANRFGDCKDTSQLLAVMLREAGIRVALATLGAQDDGQVLESVPSPWGTHAILLTTIDGKEHWIDTTAALAGWDFLPRDDRDRVCYVVDEKGNLRLTRTPPMTPESSRVEQTTRVRIGADGSSSCERVAVHSGSAAMVQRDTFLEVPAGERRRQVTSELQDANSRARLVRLDVDEQALRDFDRPVEVRMGFEIPGHFSGSPDREGSLSDSKVWGRLLAYTLDYERTAPFTLGSPFEVRHRYVVSLPPAYVLDSVPRDREVRSAWGVFRRTVRTPAGDDAVRQVEVEFFTRIDSPRVEPADFDAFRKFHEEVGQYYRVWLTLKPALEAEDAPLLEAVLAWAPDDNASAAALARLYLKTSKDADARRVLRRALFYHPEDATLGELRVKACADPREQEEAQRELVRRFPDEPRYALELGAFLVGEGRQKEARAILEPLAEEGSSSQRAQAHFHLARSYYRRDKPEQALEHLDAAEKADPEAANTVRACVLRGNVCEDLGRPTDAVGAYEAALALEPDAELALEALVRLKIALGRRADALDYLRRYVVAVGDDPAALLLGAEYSLRLERWDDALDLGGRVGEKKYPGKYHRIVGLASLHRGDLPVAYEHLTKADKDADVVEGLLDTAAQLGKLGEVSGLLKEAQKLEKPTADLRKAEERARRLLERRGRLAKELPAPAGKEKAWGSALDALVCAEDARATGQPAARVEELLSRALGQGVEPGPAVALRGRLALDRGRLGPALADGERAVSLSPRDPGGYYVRGRVRLERNLAGALDDLAKAADMGGRLDAEVLHYLAEALFGAGRVEEALAAQREAVKLKPRDREMAEQLTRFEKAQGPGGVRN
jgi:tetratricopeptide (TPR) repeat protein